VPKTSRTFRIFVSSTFSDLVAERSVLQTRDFPLLCAMSQFDDTCGTIVVCACSRRDNKEGR
jgi:hypothetical protein